MTSPPSTVTGTVLRIDARSCQVEVNGRELRVPLRGRLFETDTTEKRPVAVGDRVRVRLEGEEGVIEEVLPRRSKLSRSSAGSGDREQVLAANVDRVLLIASIVEPPFLPLLVDRALAGAEREGLPAHLVITKVDRDRKGRAGEVRSLYESIGYPVFLTSVREGHRTEESLTALRELIHSGTSVLVGPSGAGKSSLINALVPGVRLRVGSISRIRQGKHTTTHTRLVPLPGGGAVLDTPGVRNFGLFDLRAGEVDGLFPELRPLRGACEFRNCLHLVEPGCAVRAALDRGEIAPSRYASYRSLVEEARAD